MLELNADNFETEVTNSETPVIIDFWASWCGPCQMMGPVFEELSKDYTGKLKFAKLSTEEQPDLAAKFNISGIPCLIITKQGKEIDRIVGFAPKETMKEKIDAILSKI
ncbi:MAG: thioredoxin [Candidatus Aenigmarchaeota archaeon]|nr:thioredoxin [Candidatus Aenigmarchaeota archaeon]